MEILIELNRENIFKDAKTMFFNVSFFDCKKMNHKYFNNENIKSALFDSYMKQYSKKLNDVFLAIEQGDWNTIYNFQLSKEYALHHFYLRKSRPNSYGTMIKQMSPKFKNGVLSLIKNQKMTEEEVQALLNKELESTYSDLCTKSPFWIQPKITYQDVKPVLDLELLSQDILDCNFEDLHSKVEEVKGQLDEEAYELYYAFFLAMSKAIAANIPEEIKELSELNIAI